MKSILVTLLFPLLLEGQVTKPGVTMVAPELGERSNMTPLAQALAFMSGDGDHESTHAKEPRRDLKALGIATNLTLIPKAPHAFLGGKRAFDVCVTACGEAVNPAPMEPTE